MPPCNTRWSYLGELFFKQRCLFLWVVFSFCNTRVPSFWPVNDYAGGDLLPHLNPRPIYYQEEGCTFSTLIPDALNAHSETHIESRDFICAKCGATFKTETGQCSLYSSYKNVVQAKSLLMRLTLRNAESNGLSRPIFASLLTAVMKIQN